MRNRPAARRFNGRLLETAAWTFGVLLLVTYFGTLAYGEIERRQAVATFVQARSLSRQPPLPVVPVDAPTSAAAEVPGEAGEIGRGPPLTVAGLEQANWSASRMRAYAAIAADSTGSPASPVALLRIRRVGLEVPVYTDASERNLNRGAGLIAGTSPPHGGGNTGIAAHRDGYFRVLADVVLGDVLEVETHSAGKRSYRVSELSVVEPTDMSPIDATETPAVTLVTCYPFYFVGPAPQRYIVRAVAVD